MDKKVVIKTRFKYQNRYMVTTESKITNENVKQFIIEGN